MRYNVAHDRPGLIDLSTALLDQRLTSVSGFDEPVDELLGKPS